MATVVLPFAQIPRQPLEEEAGGGGVTTQTGRMHQGTAQWSPGKVDGVHGRGDLRVSPLRSARRCIVFIIRDSFQLLRFWSYAKSTVSARPAAGYGVFTP